MYYKIFLLLFFTLYHNISHISHHPTQISLLHRRPDQQHEKKVSITIFRQHTYGSEFLDFFICRITNKILTKFYYSLYIQNLCWFLNEF